jgi:hypothetical protein
MPLLQRAILEQPRADPGQRCVLRRLLLSGGAISSSFNVLNFTLLPGPIPRECQWT